MELTKGFALCRFIMGMAILGTVGAQAETVMSAPPITIAPFHPEGVDFGQSFTTPGGGPWDNVTIAFNLADGQAYPPTTTATAYLFDTSFSGQSDQIGSASFLASATTFGDALTTFVFTPSFMLLPDTQYFLYAVPTIDPTAGAQAVILDYSSTPLLPGLGTNPGGTAYLGSSVSGVSAPFQSQDFSFAFSVTGDSTVPHDAAPEPGTSILLLLGGAGLGYACATRTPPVIQRMKRRVV